LHVAAAGGHFKVVKFLASLPNVNINAMDRWHSTPHMNAVHNNHHDIAQWLVDHGAISINSQAGPALCAAAASGNLEELKRLKALGADINSGDYDARTAIHLAASEGRIEVLFWLLSNGAMLSATDRWGGTPLMDAKRHGHQEAVKILTKAYYEQGNGGHQSVQVDDTDSDEDLSTSDKPPLLQMTRNKTVN